MYGYWKPTGNFDKKGYNNQTRLEVECVCGTKKYVNKYILRSNQSKSCGCMSRKLQLENSSRTRHRHTLDNKQSPTYKAWQNMRSRSNHESYPSTERYKGRGITVCERWNIFDNFLEDMGEKPPKHDLDRIDNDKGYTPENCRWIPHRENCKNRKTSRWWVFEDKTYGSCGEIAEAIGVKEVTIRGWFSRGYVRRDKTNKCYSYPKYA